MEIDGEEKAQGRQDEEPGSGPQQLEGAAPEEGVTEKLHGHGSAPVSDEAPGVEEVFTVNRGELILEVEINLS